MLSQCNVLKNPLHTLGFKNLGGIDYSKNLSHIAKLALPYANITQGEARDIDSVSYDSVCSFSVFHYFPSLQYAKEVIARMIDKARKKVLFLDILDLEQREADIAYKKQICGDDYEKLYEGTTKHLYYPKDLFVEFAESKQCKIHIEQQNIKDYANSPFRFNVIMEKKRLMQAVILAAGLGSRLGDIKKNLPKGFLYIESLQETLIERSLRLLKEAGIQEVIIGTGYENKAYDALADRLSTKDFKITTHKNEDFATTGSAYTLWCLRELITQDFLLLESDLVYEPLAIKALLQDERKDLVLASGTTRSGDEVYMSIVQGKLQDLSKDKTKLDSIDGELVGISKISLQSFMKLDCHSQNDYEYLLKGFDVLKIDNLIWCEIDCLEHLERAKKLIIPKILKKDSQ